jgi:hypothetical protein
MRNICRDRVATVGGSPRRWGDRRYNDDGPRTRVTHYALALGLTTNQYVQRMRRT